MITRRTLEGAPKWSRRDFLLLEWRLELIFVILAGVGGRLVYEIVQWSLSSSPCREKSSQRPALNAAEVWMRLNFVCWSVSLLWLLDSIRRFTNAISMKSKKR